MTGVRVLIVDDDPLSTERLIAHLEGAGFEVAAAVDAETGLVMARQQKPRVIITDLVLPGMDGFQLTQALRDDPELAEVPVLWLTAFYGQEEIDARLAHDGLIAPLILHKPFQGGELVTQVQSLLGQPRPPAHPGHILVVEDDPANLELVTQRLEAEEFSYKTAETAGEAMERFSAETFDLVLLDLRLPDRDGLDVLEEMHQKRASVPVVLMTAHGSEAIAAQALQRGAADYLIKPVPRRELINALRNTIEKSRLQAENRQVQRNLLEALVALQRSKAEIERDHDRMAGLLDSMSDGVILFNDRLEVELFNPASLQLLRLDAPPRTYGDLVAAVKEVLRDDGTPAEFRNPPSLLPCKLSDEVVTVRWHDETVRSLSLSARPLGNQGRGGWLITFRDVTQRLERLRRLESLIQEQTETLTLVEAARAREVSEAASTAERVKNEVLSNVSHELRTPLNFIVGFGSVLADGLEGELSPRQRQIIDRMLEGADRLTQTVDDLLDYAVVASGTLEMQQEPLLLDQIASEAVMAFQPKAAKGEITLKADLLPVAAPLGDRHYTAKVLSHLLSNAIKFTPAGGRVTVRVAPEPVSGDPMVEVRDSGIGIEPDHLPQIFDRFYQVESDSTRRFGGTGLGLALVKGLACMMGARVEAESSPGSGSVFRVVWPQKP